jgi:pSer/pThr/pTyr-binding forkhead associated (FHA) protein
LAAVICMTPLLILGLLLILWALRKRPTPPPSPKPAPPPMPTGPYLEIVTPTGDPHRFDLNPDGITIGRAQENDLVITQDFSAWETVSRHHARVHQQAGRWIVEDLNSTNGIYVNERRTGRNLLRDGWRLGIGGVKFVFRAGTGEAQR